MNPTKMRCACVRFQATVLVFALAGGISGCDDPLAVDDPTAILENEISDQLGAELLRRDAIGVLFRVSGNSALESGVLADEFLAHPPKFFEDFGIANVDDLLDRRNTADLFSSTYVQWQQIWLRSTAIAREKLLAHARPGAREAHVGEMFAVRGFAATRLAEYYCPGFPLHEMQNLAVSYSPPLTTELALERALAAFDSAVTWASDSARVLNFAKVGRAHALLNLGRYADAATAVSGVPTSYVYQAQFSTTGGQQNPLSAAFTYWGRDRGVADREGGRGLDFVSANDARVRTTRRGTARDGVTGLYSPDKYPTLATQITLLSGVEARLIEAEAALKAGSPNWLTILNDLRATQISPALTPLADPGTADGRVDLVFRERAFWLFATGSRLGDLRRLIRQYGRTSESVFPTGTYFRGGTYSGSTSIPMEPDEMKFSPGVTGCTAL